MSDKKIADLPKNPVKEALLDIKVNLPQKTKLSHLESFHKKMKGNFPIKQAKMQIEGALKVGPKGHHESQTSVKQRGYQFLTVNKKKIVQVRLDGFTFNLIESYKNWSQFINEAIFYWKHYVAIAKPDNVVRIALRYINKIEIPLPMKDFKEYLKTTPEIGEGLPQSLLDFFMRLVIPDPKTNNIGIIIQTVEKSGQPIKKSKTLPFILDIDVFRLVTFSPKQKQEINKVVESLRVYKNDLFNKSITKKTIKLFK